MRKVRRTLVVVLALVLVTAVVLAGVVIGQGRRPLPQTSGTIELAGLDGKVEVLRDAQGVPHVYADTTGDLMRAQGYVQAQDRFFEMDLRRHITAGRLAELVGEPGVETDKVVRTMGWRRVAEAELPTLDPRTRQALSAYTAGVNAWIDEHGSTASMALEYTVLDLTLPEYQVEHWTSVDSLAWLKAMAWDLRGNYDGELTRALLQGRVSDAMIEDLYPAYPTREHAPILSGSGLRTAREGGEVLLVLRWGHSRRKAAELASALLARIGATQVHTLITNVDQCRHRLYGFQDRLSLSSQARS